MSVVSFFIEYSQQFFVILRWLLLGAPSTPRDSAGTQLLFDPLACHTRRVFLLGGGRGNVFPWIVGAFPERGLLVVSRVLITQQHCCDRPQTLNGTKVVRLRGFCCEQSWPFRRHVELFLHCHTFQIRIFRNCFAQMSTFYMTWNEHPRGSNARVRVTLTSTKLRDIDQWEITLF